MELFVQRLQNGKAVSVKTGGKSPVTFSIPASALKSEQFIDVAVTSFAAASIKNCRVPANRPSWFHPLAEVSNALTGTVVSDVVNIDLVSVQTGLPIKIEGLKEDITFYIPSHSDCTPTAPRACGYWTGSQWSSTGCKAVSVDTEGVQCSCSHLTEFAVVRDGSDSCAADVNAGYMTVVGVYGFSVVVAALFIGRSLMHKSTQTPQKSLIYTILALVAICRLVAALSFASTMVSSSVANFLTAVPFALFFFVHTKLFARVRQASSPTALAPSKLTPLFKIYLGFFSLGLIALLVAVFVSESASKNITMSTTRVLAAVSMIAALFFGANGVLSRPVGLKPNVGLFRTYLLTCICVLCSSLVWVALATEALSTAIFLPIDLVWGVALAHLYRDASEEGITSTLPSKTASGTTAADNTVVQDV